MSRSTVFSGPLLSMHFLADVLPSVLVERRLAPAPGDFETYRRWWKHVERSLGPASGLRALTDVGLAPLAALLGFSAGGGGPADALGRWPILLQDNRETRLAGLVVPWRQPLDRATRPADSRMRAEVIPHQRWCWAFNGTRLRVFDLDRPYAARFLDIDLRALSNDRAAFALVWTLLRADAFVETGVAQATFFAEMVALSERIGGDVRDALQGGVRASLEALTRELARTRIRHGGSSGSRREGGGNNSRWDEARRCVEQALTLLYRLLFLLFAEARLLVPLWYPVYRDGYSLAHLVSSAHRGETRGMWDALRAIGRLAHEGCVTPDGEPLTAFNGPLFAPERAPLLDRASVADAAIAQVLVALTTAPARGGRGRARITYGDLGVEQLGAIYERVLDRVPHLERQAADGQQPHPPRDEVHGEPRHATSEHESHSQDNSSSVRSRTRASAMRKETGTFYTPKALADYLVRETLRPAMADASPERLLSLRVLDPAAGSGAFLVSACQFLADAYEQAERQADGRTHTERDRARFRRSVARRCLFGVDANPMAIQLARLSLWLATLTPDEPLTFLDHRLRVGDSLVGASLDDLTRRPPAGADARRAGRAERTEPRLLFTEGDTATLMRGVVPERWRLSEPDASADDVRRKDARLASLHHGPLGRWMTLADLWCATWFWPRASQGMRTTDRQGPSSASTAPPPPAAWHALGDVILHGRSTLPAHIADPWLTDAAAIARARRFFHWTLEFPEVFCDEDGEPRADAGFDVIIGNPPWEMLRDDTPRAPHENGRDPADEDANADRTAVNRFVRESGLYDVPHGAHVNCYHLFLERALTLLKPGGQLGMIVPWGLASDRNSARIRRRLLERCEIRTLVSFDNRAGLFPVHRSMRFLLVTATRRGSTDWMSCRFGESDPAALDAADGDPVRAPVLRLSRAWLGRVSGEDLAIPDVRSPDAVRLLQRLHDEHQPLASPDGWHASFGRELNASDDRGHFIRARHDASAPRHDHARTEAAGMALDDERDIGERDIPVIEGKHLAPFTVRLADVTRAVPRERWPWLRRRCASAGRERLAYRDIASPTNRLTLIAAVLPAETVSTHTITCLKTALSSDEVWCLCGLLNSFVSNYLVRLRVTTHVTKTIVERLPVPFLTPVSPLFHEMVACARRMASARASPADAADVQACAAEAYGLTVDELAHVLSTFPLIDRRERQRVADRFRARLGPRSP